MRNLARSKWILLLPTLWLAEAQLAHALQQVEAADGVTVEALLSVKEPTRIRIDGSAITNVFGNIYSSNCGGAVAQQAPGTTGPTAPQVNPAGEVVLECDAEKGEVYVRPVGAGGKPVNLFISSQHATYTLLLRRSETPADTIVIRDKTPRQSKADTGSAAGRQTQHIRTIKAMLVAMASDRVPTDVRVEEVDRPIQLWTEAKFSLIRLYDGRGLLGERYILTNVSNQDMVLAEQEFDRDGGGVLAVSVENHNLRPGESTSVYVIRQGS